ncbi:MAG: alanyl-tRNA synthetase [Actinomycetota bacterium]|nr:alanyl-tRNA synthetase [Actinomycetota bacterium]
MNGDQIRETFLSFFEERGHKRVPSSSLIPPPETGLLLANAGMNQFIPYFLGQAPAPFVRATSCQKCFRANDIENVGHTARHLTMFEMLGNFSFGDYFKAEAIGWAHELVTDGYGIDPGRLWVTVFETDEEATEAWRALGLPTERIVRRGKFDEHGEPANFWSTHAAGPAGPCSEIFVDRGARYGPEGGPDVDEERFMEIWNLVFMQDEVDADEEVIRELPAKNIDTGSSLERVATVLQGKDNYFETDIFRPLFEVVENLSGRRHGADARDDVSLKVIAEHGRSVSFLIADGVQPSNEGRGYILRRMLRRVVTHARRLGIDKPVMEPLVDRTVELMGHAYPELVENRAFILQVVGGEEERFGGTLRQGMQLFERALGTTPAGGTFPGEETFKLFDTFGFPPQLTEELVAEAGRTVDMDRFTALMHEQRERARGSAKKVPIGLDAGAAPAAEFVGYGQLEAESKIGALLDPDFRELSAVEEGQAVRLFLDVTPFYPEGGGQVGDHGRIRTTTGVIQVTDTQRIGDHSIMHLGTVEAGEVRADQEAHAEVDVSRREATARAHTSTHIVHWTMKHLLGEHARQAGSLVAPGRLRFDFPHPSAVPQDVLDEVELEANRRLASDDAITIFETSMAEAKALGATALFGEKYGDVVRVVEVGDYSRELCGGTHVQRTGNIAIVKILHEGSIGAGMRRVEALVGPDALREINAERALLDGLVKALGSKDPRSALDHARRVLEENKRLKNELGALRAGDRDTLLSSLAETADTVDGVVLVVAEVPGEDMGGLRDLAQKLRDKLASQPAAVVLGNGENGKAQLVSACTAGAVERGVTAPELLRDAAALVGGGAGGKDILANAGGKHPDQVPAALAAIPGRLKQILIGGA